MQEKQSENTLLDVFESLRKHTLGMLIVFIGVVLLVIVVTFMQTPIYEIASSVLVKYGREYVYRGVDKSKEGNVAPQYFFNRKEVINTELEIFRSNELAEKVINSFGVEQFFPDLARKVQSNDHLLPLAINRFRKQLNVFHVKDSSVIGVTFQHHDPEIAVQAVNILTELFKDRHLQIFKNPQTSFLEKQVAVYREKLQESENTLRTFKQENQIFSLEDQRRYLMEQYVGINTILITGNSDLEKSAQRAASLERELEAVPEVVALYDESGQVTNVDNANNARLLTLQLRESELMEKYPEDNRLIVAVREDIAMVEKFIGKNDISSKEFARTGKNVVFQQLNRELVLARADYAALEKKNESLRRQLLQLEDKLRKMTEQESELNLLSLQVETTEEAYKTFNEKLEDSRLQDAMDSQKMVNVVVLEKPMVPVKPIKPRKKLNLLVGVILGAACSLFYALFTEQVAVRKT